MCTKCTVLRLPWKKLQNQRKTVTARGHEADPDIITTTPIPIVTIHIPIATILMFVTETGIALISC